MAQLLHIDSSILGEHSTSRTLTARAAERWLAANPGGTVTYRDLAVDPVPHLDGLTLSARNTDPAEHTPEQAAAYAVGIELIEQVAAADTVLLGLPLYNFGAPSTVKAWVDHVVWAGVSYDGATGEGKLGGRDFLVLASRGGGYGEGTPRHGWDHASTWLPHGISMTGLEPKVIAAEMRLSYTVPALNEFIPMAEAGMAAAEAAIDAHFAPVPA